MFSLLGFPWLGLIVGYKIFPCMDVREGQAKPCWTRHALCSHRPLPCCRPITPLEDSRCLHVYAVRYQGEVVGLRRLFCMSSHVYAQWSCRLPCMQCVYKISSLVAPYSMALLALADRPWSVVFLSFIIYSLKKESSLMTLWAAFIKC